MHKEGLIKGLILIIYQVLQRATLYVRVNCKQYCFTLTSIVIPLDQLCSESRIRSLVLSQSQFCSKGTRTPTYL